MAHQGEQGSRIFSAPGQKCVCTCTKIAWPDGLGQEEKKQPSATDPAVHHRPWRGRRRAERVRAVVRHGTLREHGAPLVRSTNKTCQRSCQPEIRPRSRLQRRALVISPASCAFGGGARARVSGKSTTCASQRVRGCAHFQAQLEPTRMRWENDQMCGVSES